MKNTKKSKKKKKKAQNINKFKYLKICIAIIIIISIVVGIYFFLTAEDDETNLTILEKQWIMRNKKTLMDINVPNNLSILADDGNGVVFDYLSRIEKDTGLKFNKKSYNYKTNADSLDGLSIVVLSNEDKLNDTDVLFAEDNYVLIGMQQGYLSNLNGLYNNKIGILKGDKSIVSNYVNISYSYVEYNSLETLEADLKAGKIKYAIVPRYYALKQTVNQKAYINYSFNNLSNKIVLRQSDNKRLSQIMVKFLNSFKSKKYMDSYEKAFMNFYLNNTSATDLDTSSLSSKVYTYGYVKDSTYNILKGKSLYGFAGEYINLLSNMADIDLDFKEYSSSEELSSAIKSGNVDVAFIDFDYKNEQGLYTVSSFSPEMVAISKSNYRISSKEGLQNRKLYTTNNNYLVNYLKDNYQSDIKTIKSIDNSVPDDAILVLDETDYYYYVNRNKLNNYNVLLKDDYAADYKFYIKNNEKVMYDFINFMLMYTDGSDIKIQALNQLVSVNEQKGGFVNLYLMVVLVVMIPIIIFFALLALAKARKNIKILRKEDVLKYSDMLTSLKNRNYLNANIDEWDEQKIIPRTIVIADLNNLKYINDNYGQEEGDLLIKKAAAILINTQLEKSEIIRTDGNEFLIYLIGYNKTQIKTYINKLSREFEKLPHGFGAAIGYSMIEDEIKTINDAINEAGIEMRTDKEQNYK